MPPGISVVGASNIGNFRLGYVPRPLVPVRTTRVRITLDGVLVRYRTGTVTIQDRANDAPNVCSLTINADTPPVRGQRMRVTINSNAPRLLGGFSGAIEKVDETYEGYPGQLVYHCVAQDDTPRANRRMPLGYWEDVSATIVVQELVAAFVPGFSAAGVQVGLPSVTILVDGSEAGINGVLRAICKLIGAYFYWEDFVLYLFLEAEGTDLPDPLDMTPKRFEDDPPIRVSRDDKQIRTRVFGKGHQEATLAEIAPGVSTIPLGDVSMYNPAGGQVISEAQILDYTGTSVGGVGALVGTTITPTNGPTVTGRATTGITAGTRDWAVTFGTTAGQTLPGPRTTFAIGGPVSPPIAPPTVGTPTPGGSVTAGSHEYAVAFVTAAGGETTLSPIGGPVVTGTPGYVTPPSSSPSANAASAYTQPFWPIGTTISCRVTYLTASGETTAGPSSGTVTIQDNGGGTPRAVTLTGIPVSSDPAVTGKRIYYTHSAGGSGYESISAAATTHEAAGSLSAGSPPASNTAVSTTTGTVPLTNIPLGPAGVTERNLYRRFNGAGTFKRVTNLNDNTTQNYTDTNANGALGPDALTTATAVTGAADIANIPIGPSGTTFRNIWRSTFFGGPLKFLATIANNTGTTLTDSTADGSLGADVHTTDTSGLVGQSGEVPAGSTSLLVTATPFPPDGGWVSIGAMTILYTGINGSSLTGIPAVGPGSLTTSIRYGAEIVVASVLTGVTGLVRTLIKGAPIHIWVQEDDLDAQAELAARDGSDGIIEHRIVDERRGEASLRALCRADLRQFSRPLATVPYATRDVKTKSGKPVVIDIPSPFIDETLTIQDVTITEIDVAPGMPPKFTVLASSARFSLEDILRRTAGLLEGR